MFQRLKRTSSSPPSAARLLILAGMRRLALQLRSRFTHLAGLSATPAPQARANTTPAGGEAMGRRE